MPNKRALFVYFFLFLIIGIEQTYSQCSMCRAVLQSEEGQATAKGTLGISGTRVSWMHADDRRRC